MAGTSRATRRNRQAWEDWAELDPMWSILTEPGMRGRGWSTEEFFQSGRQAVDALLAQAAADGLPDRRGAALDFGCGIGRLTPALAVQSAKTAALGSSAAMVRQAAIPPPG